MSVFTILNCGTNFDRTKRGELVADFGAMLTGVEYQNFLITDGVGSKGNKSNPMPGTFDPFTKNKTPKGKTESWSKTPMQTLSNVSTGEGKFSPTGHGVLRGLTSNTGNTNAAITGHGWDDNIRHAIAVLSEAFPGLQGTINMIGWSRGAVTCLRMANWIKEFLGPGFEINIFAVDPVAGLDAGERLQDTYFVPDNVKNYVGILALDDMRGDFKPQDLSRLVIQNCMITNLAMLPFPGVHNTPVVMKSSKLAEVTRMVRHLAYKFLTTCGTQFKIHEPIYSLVDCCRLYAAMMLKRSQYSKLGKGFKNSLMGGLIERTVKANVQGYVAADSNFFVNEHHRECFQGAYPDIYNYFFTNTVPNPLGKSTTSFRATDRWAQKLQQFYQIDPDSFELLSSVYTAERKGGVGMPAVWTVSAPGVGAVSVPPPPNVTAAVRMLC
ncbi:DUF5621 domain-containing protein [uncultured Paludibaculum sp.]|uniref:DUF5621 domain-containing protein n=1 Tax=uncultured Paludibaculum sp. TaxID=1765020 RepID=UPI002AAC0620|nr:DUF5621 domain-containing protein [uncultured Paludibaculum sp.]